MYCVYVTAFLLFSEKLAKCRTLKCKYNLFPHVNMHVKITVSRFLWDNVIIFTSPLSMVEQSVETLTKSCFLRFCFVSTVMMHPRHPPWAAVPWTWTRHFSKCWRLPWYTTVSSMDCTRLLKLWTNDKRSYAFWQKTATSPCTRSWFRRFAPNIKFHSSKSTTTRNSASGLVCVKSTTREEQEKLLVAHV